MWRCEADSPWRAETPEVSSYLMPIEPLTDWEWLSGELLSRSECSKVRLVFRWEILDLFPNDLTMACFDHHKQYLTVIMYVCINWGKLQVWVDRHILASVPNLCFLQHENQGMGDISNGNYCPYKYHTYHGYYCDEASSLPILCSKYMTVLNRITRVCGP